VAWPRPHTWRSQIHLPLSFLQKSLILVHQSREWCTFVSPLGYETGEPPWCQPNVLQASHLKLETKSENEKMTQHWG
jgi:hypothetical protein